MMILEITPKTNTKNIP